MGNGERTVLDPRNLCTVIEGSPRHAEGMAPRIPANGPLSVAGDSIDEGAGLPRLRVGRSKNLMVAFQGPGWPSSLQHKSYRR